MQEGVMFRTRQESLLTKRVTTRAYCLPARVGVNLEACSTTTLVAPLNVINPFNAVSWARNSIIVNIPLHADDPRYTIKIVIDRVHGKTKRKTEKDLPMSTPTWTALGGSNLPCTLWRMSLPDRIYLA